MDVFPRSQMRSQSVGDNSFRSTSTAFSKACLAGSSQLCVSIVSDCKGTKADEVYRVDESLRYHVDNHCLEVVLSTRSSTWNDV